MQRCTHPTAVEGGLFTDGNPTTGVPATTPAASWFNSAQEELATLVEENQQLDPERYDQVLEAITAIALGRSLFTNELINGRFDLWQRGTSFNVTSTERYGPDRYFLKAETAGAGAATVTQQTFPLGQTDVPGHPGQYMRWLQTAVATGQPRVGQRVESLARFFGATLTVRFWAKCLTAQSCTLKVDRNFGSGGSAPDSVYSSTFGLVNAWQRFTFTFTVPAYAGQTFGSHPYLEVRVEMPSGATFQLDLAEWSLQYGRFASPTPHVDVATELIRARRYFEKTYARNTAPGTVGAQSYVRARQGVTPTCTGIDTRFSIEKRTTPTVVWYAIDGTINSCTNNGATDAVAAQSGHSLGNTGTLDVTTTGADRIIEAHWTADAEL